MEVDPPADIEAEHDEMVDMANNISRLLAQLNALNDVQIGLEQRNREARAEYMRVQKAYEAISHECSEHGRLMTECRSNIQATQMRFINLWISHMSGHD